MKLEPLLEHEIELLVRMIVHDLEKPLSVTGRILQRILNRKLDPLNEDHARLIQASFLTMGRSQRMLADLGEVISRRRLPVYIQTVSLGELTDKIANGFLPLAEMESQQFVFRCDKDRSVQTDPELVARVADNFLINALNHNPPGAPIRLEVQGIGTRGFRLAVANKGSPIPQDRLESIFQPGVQLHLRNERIWRGQGLGLAFCRIAADAVGGCVQVTSPPDSEEIEFSLIVTEPDRNKQPDDKTDG